MESSRTPFAFRLVDTHQDAQADRPQTTQWQTRDGVAAAGCTDPRRTGDYRYGDGGIWC